MCKPNDGDRKSRARGENLILRRDYYGTPKSSVDTWHITWGYWLLEIKKVKVSDSKRAERGRVNLKKLILLLLQIQLNQRHLPGLSCIHVNKN